MKKGKLLNLEDISTFQDASVINSIYLDNKERQMYHERTGLAGPKVCPILYDDHVLMPSRVI